MNSSCSDAENIGRLPISDVALETYSELSQEDSDDNSVAPDVPPQRQNRSTRKLQKLKYLNDFNLTYISQCNFLKRLSSNLCSIVKFVKLKFFKEKWKKVSHARIIINVSSLSPFVAVIHGTRDGSHDLRHFRFLFCIVVVWSLVSLSLMIFL